MNTARTTIALLLAAASAATFAAGVRADFTISPPLMHSAGPLGNAGNSAYMYTYSGPSAVVTGGTFAGAISSIILGTTIGEARWNLRNTRFGTTGSVSFQPANLGYFENSVLVIGTPGGGMILRDGDVIRIETHESGSAADDGPGTDAVWNNVTWTFQTAVIEDLGNFAAVTSMRTSGGPGFGTDTEIALFDAAGLLLRSNDDFGGTSGSGFTGLSLADGTYYLSVTPYDSTFANGLVRPGYDGIGDFTLAFNGVAVDSATLGAYSTLWYRFTIGTPCVADVDDGTGSGTPDGGVGIEDLLYYLGLFDAGFTAADVDDGTGTGTPDGGVGIEDLLYYLLRFDAGC